MSSLYLDSSAIVKLVLHEAESDALRGFLRDHALRSTCGLARTEVPRAVAHAGAAATDLAHEVLAGIQLMQLDDALLDAAGSLESVGLRSLDAIHLVAARRLGRDLTFVVTYDRRMASAAESIGLAVVAPA